MRRPILTFKNVTKSFMAGGNEVCILNNVSIDILSGEKVAIIGPSGSGKSTFLSLAGLLDTPTAGEVLIAGESVQTMSERQQAKTRNTKIGFVFQSFELITPFTVTENIVAPLEIMGSSVVLDDVLNLLNEVGLGTKASALPSTLSGGEKQRVAIARALIHKPALILADEPTGSLDRATGERVLSLLLESVEKRGATLIVITHDEHVAAQMDRVFEIKDQTLYERH